MVKFADASSSVSIDGKDFDAINIDLVDIQMVKMETFLRLNVIRSGKDYGRVRASCVGLYFIKQNSECLFSELYLVNVLRERTT